MIAFLAALVLTQPAAATVQSPVPFPHPLITEVLYAVPPREAGDANKDGKRDVNGDEFVELVNPHDKPIQLAGYVLADRDLADGEKKTSSIRFTFPVLELKPGQVVVVFNGHNQKWTGPVGDATKGLDKGNELFANAFVLTMGITSEKKGLANKGDCIQLISPDSKFIHCIHWGDAKPSANASLIEEAPVVTSASVQRTSLAGKLEPHPADDKGVQFSPGKWPPGAAPTEAPADKPVEKPKDPPKKPDHNPAAK